MQSLTDTTVRIVTKAEDIRNKERRIAALHQKKAVQNGWLSPVDAAELRDLLRKVQA